MQAELWKKVESLCNAALALPLEQRAAFLLQACPEDSELRSEVQSLLDQHVESFLEGSPLSSIENRLNDSGSEDPLENESTAKQAMELASAPGAMIGPYELIEIVGQGGMGEVWLAEQKQPVRRGVALKLIKAGMDTREVIARFESERQALALMDHPAIAKVFEAGSTAEGRPYFVMEYVAGMPITTYCDKHKLSSHERLKLFIHVCEGVQHAHQKAIIHRDLKPSNILVGEIDGKPQPKIIDFGVSKAMTQGLDAQTVLTRLGFIVGTPEYMSPEQAELSREDVDTRSDVYSLGVVLYELLVGALPLDFRKSTLDEALRRLREEDAPKPSSKLRTQGVETEKTARNRGTDLAALVRQVRGDPDAIVLKALEKNRGRRYSTPLELAADISRYLHHEPVTAHPPSVAYQARKYARRHRVGVAFTAMLVLLMAGAAVIQAVQVRRVALERERADSEAAISQAVTNFLENDVLAQASAANQSGPTTKPDPHLEVRTALERAAARIGGKFDRQPEVEAAIRDTIGHTYIDLGLYPEAQTQLERALQLHRRISGGYEPATLRTMSRLGDVAILQGGYPKAEELLTKSIEIQRRVLGPEHPDTLASVNSLATVYEREGKYTQAEPLFVQILDIRRRVLGSAHRDTLKSMNDLAVVYAEEGKYPQVEPLFRQMLDTYRRVFGPEHPDTLRSMDNLANTYQAEGKYTEAEASYRQATEIKRRVLGSEHPETLRSMGNLALIYDAEGNYAQAERLQGQVLEASRRVLGREHPETLISMGNLADTNDEEGKYGQAEVLFGQTLEIERRVLGSEHPNTLETLSEFAWMRQRQGEYASAETYTAQVLAGRRSAFGSDNPDTMSSAAELALAYVSEGKFSQSEPLAREALEFNDKNHPDTWQRFRAESILGASLAGQKKFAEAEPLLLEGYRGMSARKPQIDVPDWYHIDRARDWIIGLYQAWGRLSQAAEWKRK